MKLFKFLIITVFCAVLMTSCAQTVSNTADEIRMNKWSAKLKSGSSVNLSVDDDFGTFQVKSKDRDARVKLSGLCVIDSDSIVIIDSKDKQSYRFSYKLHNNKLKLEYNGGKITLKR
ncbi:MAG: hypothetical protein J1E96_04315 [Ruminococcus sp.]|nr:hypothetical protein [Ruminococcus sp.]